MSRYRGTIWKQPPSDSEITNSTYYILKFFWFLLNLIHFWIGNYFKKLFNSGETASTLTGGCFQLMSFSYYLSSVDGEMTFCLSRWLQFSSVKIQLSSSLLALTMISRSGTLARMLSSQRFRWTILLKHDDADSVEMSDDDDIHIPGPHRHCHWDAVISWWSSCSH